MSTTARGYVILATTVGGLAAALYFTRPTMFRRGPPAPVSTPAAVPAPGSPAACAALEVRYRTELDAHAACTKDDDCQVERRGPAAGRCFHYRSLRRDAPRTTLDALESDWVKGCHGIGGSETCGPLPAPACRGGRCTEKPPPPIPEDWNRTVCTGIFALYLPPYLELEKGSSPRMRMRGCDHGHGNRRLRVALDDRDLDPRPEAFLVHSGSYTLKSTTPITIAGYSTSLYAYQSSAKSRPDGGAPVSIFGAFVDHVAGARAVSIVYECDDKRSCADARTIFESFELRSEPPAAPLPDP